QGRGNHTGGPYLNPMMTLTGLTSDVSAAWGGETACAIGAGALECWGEDRYGMIGGGNDNGEQDAPVAGNVAGVTAWQQVSVGTFHTCAIADGTHLYCWGSNIDAQLGDPTVLYNVNTPREIDPTHDWQVVSAGYRDTCAITTAGELYCWGWN